MSLPEPLAHWMQYGHGMAVSVELPAADMDAMVRAFGELQRKHDAAMRWPNESLAYSLGHAPIDTRPLRAAASVLSDIGSSLTGEVEEIADKIETILNRKLP